MKVMYLFFIPIIVNKPIEFCEYNIDCKLPKICCKGFLANYCCIQDKYVLAPIPIKRRYQ